MKYLIAFFTGFLFASNLHAQSNFYKDSLLNSLEKNRYSLNKSNSFKQKNYTPLKLPQINAAPKNFDGCVLKLPKPSLVYIGNSNQSNIYQSTPDKMYIIKPDSTFKSNMPIADISK